MRVQRGERGGGRRVPRAPHRLPRDRVARRRRALAGRRSSGARPGRASRGGRARPRSGGGRVSFLAAIVGLTVLVLLHEAGHFFAARAVGMTPRKFYLGFGPPIVKRVHNGVEYGIGALPLGGYVKLPGMHRPSAADVRGTIPADEQRELEPQLDA